MVRSFVAAAVTAAALLCATNAAAQTAAEKDFAAVVADFGAFEKANDPVSAGFEGDKAAQSRLPDPSVAAAAARKTALEGFRTRLAAIDATQLGPEPTLDRDFLTRVIADRLDSIRFDEARAPFANDDGFFSLPNYLASATIIRSTADAEAWIARMEAMPVYFDAETVNMRRGMATHFMQPRVVVEAALVQLRALPATAADSPLMAPFAKLPATIPAADQAALRARALATIGDKVLPAQRAVLAFMEQTYLPHAPLKFVVGRGLREVNLIAVGRTEGEGRGGVFDVVELVFVKHREAAGREHGVGGHDEFAGAVLRVADVPAAEVHRPGADVLDFHGVFERQVGVAQHFADDDVGERQIVRLVRAVGGREAEDGRAAVGQTAFGNAGLLREELAVIRESAKDLRRSTHRDGTPSASLP